MPAPPPQATEVNPHETGSRLRRHWRWAGRGVWAMADQGFFAGANFLITVGLAIWLSERDFGAFTTAYASFLIIGVFTTALLTEPMMVFGSQKYRDNLPDYFGKLIGGHLVITFIGGLIIAGIGLGTWFAGERLLGIAMCGLAVTQVSQLLPWMTRNACYIESNPRPAALSGVVYFVLILGSLLLLNVLNQLNIVTAILTMGAASLVVNAYLLIHLRVNLRSTLRVSGYGPVIADHWRYGKWAMPTGLTRYVPEQLPYVAVPLILGFAAGGSPDLETGGALKALMNFAVPMVLVGWAISTLVVPMLVRARRSKRFAKVSLMMLLITAGLPLLCWPLLGIFGEPIIGLVYRGKYTEHAAMMWLIGLIPVIAGIDSVLHSQLKAAERPDRLFLASVASSIVLVVTGLPMVLVWGLPGAIIAVLLSYVAQALTLVAFGGRIILHQSTPPAAEARALAPMDLPPLADRPLVSVLMANYNYGHLIESAIRSVRDQTYDRWELIVIDDGSTDDSSAVVERLAADDARITLIRQENRGQGGAWNHGFEHCRGDVLCLLDSDDLFEPGKLDAVVSVFAEDAGVGMVQHPMQVIDSDGKPLQVIPFLSRLEDGWLGPTVARRGGRWCYMPTSALAFRMEVARKLLPLDARRYRICADALLFTLGPMLTRVRVVPRPLTRYRVHGSNNMSSGVTDQKYLRKRVRSFHDTVLGTNQHVARLDLGLPTLHPTDHLQYREHLFMLSMLRGRRRGWVGRYAGLMRAVLRDDMYGSTQKALAVGVYGLLPLMPRRWRGPWLDRTRSFGRLKGVVQGVLRLTRLRPRTRHESPETPQPPPPETAPLATADS